MKSERKELTKPQRFDHTMNDREFFYKISTPDKVNQYYLSALENARGFTDKFQYLMPQDILCMVMNYINKHKNKPGCNTDNIVFLNDTPALPQLTNLLLNQELKNNEDLKLILKIKPNEIFPPKPDAWPNESVPSLSSNVAKGLHTTWLYLRNENNVLKIFVADAGGGVFFDYKDGFSQLTDVLTQAALKKYAKVQIIKCSAPTQNSWRDCPIFMMDGLDLMCKEGSGIFASLEPCLVAQKDKIIDKSNPHVYHLKIDHTPPRLLRYTTVNSADQINAAYRLPASYYDNPHFLVANGNAIVKQKPRMTLSEYYKENIENVFVDDVLKYSINRAPNRKFIKERFNIYKFMQQCGILNSRNEFNAIHYNNFIRECLNRKLISQETAGSLKFTSAIEELILGKQYSLSETHYSGYDPKPIDYSVMMKKPDSLTPHFKSSRLYQSMQPVSYTQDYRDKYFSLKHAEMHAPTVSCPPNRTVLWSGGYIPSHPNYYGLGRISAEAGIAYLNELMSTVDDEKKSDLFHTVAMTEVGLPVLNPMWDDPLTPFSTKCSVTPHYITSFARNAKGDTINLNVDDTDCDSFFRKNELAIVMSNPKIKKIRVFRVDPKTHLPILKTYSKEDWYQAQKDQWVQSIIVRSELILAEIDRLNNLEEKISNELLSSKKRIIGALIDEVKETLGADSGDVRNLRRLAEISTYYHQRKNIFIDHLDAKSIRIIKLAKMKYYGKLIASLVKSKNELGFNQHYWLEIIDPIHRNIKFHEIALKEWKNSNTRLNYFSWLDQCYPSSQYDEHIHYHSLEDQKHHIVTINEEGKLLQNEKLLSTKNFLGKIPEYGMFVLVDTALEGKPQQPNILIGEYAMKFQQHTSLSRGKRVISAGMMRVENGKITHISFVSGHNKPDYKSIEILLNSLSDQALQNVTIVLSYDAWTGGLGTKSVWEEKQFDAKRIRDILEKRQSHAKIDLSLKITVEHHAEEKVEKFPTKDQLTPYNIPMVDHAKSALRLYPKATDGASLVSNIYHYRYSRHSLDQLLMMSKKSGYDLKTIAFNAMKWERILLHTVIATLMVNIKPNKINQQLVDDFYQVALGAINNQQIIELSHALRIEIERFVEIYRGVGEKYAKNERFYNEFAELFKRLDISSDFDV